jgi:GNAT superfamily N-acetyltransferase
MAELIREYRAGDEEAVVRLSLRAWAPVFLSLSQILGREISGLLHGDWRRYQENAVRAVLADRAVRVWVAGTGVAAGAGAAAGTAVAAGTGAAVTGFVAATVHADRLIGEITMLAVDPAAQDRGTGTALTEFATAWLRDAGMRIAMVETGGDDGHAAGRRVYEKADYVLLPVARYFRAL